MSEVIVKQNGFVLEVLIDRPKKKNSLTFAMYDALTAALVSAQHDASIRVVLLSGAGDAFTAGNDLTDFLELTAFDPRSAPPIRFIHAMIALDKAFIVAVKGAAVGIGTTLLLHADLVYAAESARFSVPFVNLGIVPEAASTILLPRRIGHAAASDMLLRGTVLSAERALVLGLVNEVVKPPQDVLAFARERALEVATKPPQSLRLTKSLTREDRKLVTERVLEEAIHLGERLVSGEAKEAFSAFLERRTPDFSKFS